GRLRHGETAAGTERDIQRSLDQFIGAITDEDAFRSPAGKFRQRTDDCGRYKFRITSPRTPKYASHDLPFDVHRQLIRVLVLIEFDVGVKMLERVRVEAADLRLYDAGS